MTKKEKELIWQSLVAGAVYVQDVIDLEKAGTPSGLDKGVPQKDLREIKKALKILERDLNE